MSSAWARYSPAWDELTYSEVTSHHFSECITFITDQLSFEPLNGQRRRGEDEERRFLSNLSMGRGGEVKRRRRGEEERRRGGEEGKRGGGEEERRRGGNLLQATHLVYHPSAHVKSLTEPP